MDQRAWIKLKESLKKLPPLDQRIALERQLQGIEDNAMRQEILKMLAMLPPTVKLEIQPPKQEKENNAWKSLGRSVDKLAFKRQDSDDQEEKPRLAEFKAQTPTLDTLVEETPAKKEEEKPLDITYGVKQTAYGDSKDEYKPAELKPAGTPAEVFKQEQQQFEDKEDFVKGAVERELKKTEKYKRFGT